MEGVSVWVGMGGRGMCVRVGIGVRSVSEGRGG